MLLTLHYAIMSRCIMPPALWYAVLQMIINLNIVPADIMRTLLGHAL